MPAWVGGHRVLFNGLMVCVNRPLEVRCIEGPAREAHTGHSSTRLALTNNKEKQMDDDNLRIEALNVAAKLAMSSNLQSANVLTQAREFYGFLSGDKDAPVSSGTYSVTINNPIKRSF